ncbi:MAG: recombinase family protein [Parcubacteria group bacterium]|jgi:hypothetical protein
MNQKITQSIKQAMENQFNNISIITKRGLRNKAENGWCPYSPPLGYLTDSGKNKCRKETVIDPKKFELIKKAFELIYLGKNTPLEAFDIVTSEWGLTNKNGARISFRSWCGMLTNPFYYGEFEYPKDSGKWYKGKHNPMLTQAEFLKIQAFLNKK